MSTTLSYDNELFMRNNWLSPTSIISGSFVTENTIPDNHLEQTNGDAPSSSLLPATSSVVDYAVGHLPSHGISKSLTNSLNKQLKTANLLYQNDFYGACDEVISCQDVERIQHLMRLGNITLCLKWPIGTGKTEFISKILADFFNILGIAPTRALVKQLATRLGLHYYEDDKKNTDESLRGTAVCLNSVEKYGKHNIVVFDEAMECHRNLLTSSTINNKRETNRLTLYESIDDVMRDAGVVILADAFLTPSFIERHKRKFPHRKIIGITPDGLKVYPAVYNVLPDHETALLLARDILLSGGNVWCYTTSVMLTSSFSTDSIRRYLSQFIPESEILMVNRHCSDSQKVKEILANPDKELKERKIRCVVCSPSIGSGVSITSMQFTTIAFVSSYFLPSSIVQAMGRARIGAKYISYKDTGISGRQENVDDAIYDFNIIFDFLASRRARKDDLNKYLNKGQTIDDAGSVLNELGKEMLKQWCEDNAILNKGWTGYLEFCSDNDIITAEAPQTYTGEERKELRKELKAIKEQNLSEHRGKVHGAKDTYVGADNAALEIAANKESLGLLSDDEVLALRKGECTTLYGIKSVEITDSHLKYFDANNRVVWNCKLANADKESIISRTMANIETNRSIESPYLQWIVLRYLLSAFQSNVSYSADELKKIFDGIFELEGVKDLKCGLTGVFKGCTIRKDSKRPTDSLNTLLKMLGMKLVADKKRIMVEGRQYKTYHCEPANECVIRAIEATYNRIESEEKIVHPLLIGLHKK